MAKRIGVLTSGGDAPGMNAAIRAVVRSGIKLGYEMFAIEEGYKGMVEGDIKQVDRSYVSDILQRGGTILKTARLPSFKDKEVMQQGIDQLTRFGIDALVVIGGDGTYRGARDLSKLGIQCVGIPATIDNDIASTDYTIGFDTCLNTIIECVDKLRDTTASHERCSLIEVMGHHCGDLALFSGLAEGAEMVLIPDKTVTEEDMIEKLKVLKEGRKKHAIVIVSEFLFDDINALAKRITTKTGFESRAEVLGRIQRGGSPSAFDRILAARLGAAAINFIKEGKTSICVGIKNNVIKAFDIDEALAMPRTTNQEFKDLVDTLK